MHQRTGRTTNLRADCLRPRVRDGSGHESGEVVPANAPTDVFRGRESFTCVCRSHRPGSNWRPTVYETVALTRKFSAPSEVAQIHGACGVQFFLGFRPSDLQNDERSTKRPVATNSFCRASGQRHSVCFAASECVCDEDQRRHLCELAIGVRNQDPFQNSRHPFRGAA